MFAVTSAGTSGSTRRWAQAQATLAVADAASAQCAAVSTTCVAAVPDPSPVAEPSPEPAVDPAPSPAPKPEPSPSPAPGPEPSPVPMPQPAPASQASAGRHSGWRLGGLTLNQSRKETVAWQGELQLHMRVVVHHRR